MPQDLSTIALRPSERGVLVGETGTGKSTLAERLMAHFHRTNAQPRLLIVDSKPRFRAEWELSGMSTRMSRRYKGWKRGAAVPGSFVLPLEDPWAELRQVWAHGSTIAVAQGENPRALLAAAQAFFEKSDDDYQQLAYFDEGADFFGTSASFSIGHPMLRLVRSGRERGIATMLSSQRPRHIPPAVLTECTQLYAFPLSFDKDWNHLREMGLPRDLTPPADVHSFVHYDKRKRHAGVYRLRTLPGGGLERFSWT